jgi:DNA-binding NtrC family response regulator
MTTITPPRPATRLHLLSTQASKSPPFVGASPAIRELLALSDRFAGTDLPLLITGESGTGKEVLARRIHARSPRADGPFVAENCAAIPHSLIESELFGHVRGAYTGADRDRPGAFARADGGTFLLDEIGDMPLATQAKLLRVLEDGCVRPLGSSSATPVDVRILCATNRDLPELVREGRFRTDLYYRLCGATLWIPPLRERSDDVPELARHLLHGLNVEHGTDKRLDPGLIERLPRRLWPGNVRELRNLVLSLYHLAEGAVLDDAVLDDAGLDLDVDRARERECVVSAVAPLAEIERDAIRLALHETGGNRMEAARRLGLSRSGLYAKMKRHGLSSEDHWGFGLRVAKETRRTPPAPAPPRRLAMG